MRYERGRWSDAGSRQASVYGGRQKVKGLAPLACKTDKIDSKVLAVLSHGDLVPAIWLPAVVELVEYFRRTIGSSSSG